MRNRKRVESPGTVDRAPGFIAGLRVIYAQLTPARARQFQALLGLLVLNAVAELGTIGAVLPLLTLIGDAGTAGQGSGLTSDVLAFAGKARDDQLIAAAVLFSAFALASGLSRMQLARTTFGFGYELAHELTLEIHSRLLAQPYIFHAQRNTSTLISALDKANILVFEVVLPLTQAVSAAVISLVIVAVLIVVDPITALAALSILGGIYLLISAATSGRLATNSRVIAKSIDERLKIVQESLGGVRDVIIDGSQSVFLEKFDRENTRLGRARANTAVIAMAPRFLIETAGMIALAVIALLVSQDEGGLAAALPVLGAMALGAQRLLPLIQQVYRGWSTASGHLSVIGDTVDLLALPIGEQADRSDTTPLPFRHKITFEDVGFTYPNRPTPALQAISFEIPAGSAVALVGGTGSGKSTLADLLMGLLDAGQGRICIDGELLAKGNRRRWQRSIAHVPQSIFLTDDSVAHNIALSLPGEPLDHHAIVEAAKRAQLHDFIDSLPDGYGTPVGERGIRLSGGQRQRLGIARANYKSAPVLILDEATSALDVRTEAAVLDGLEELRHHGRTLIIIAHRASTIAKCDLVVRLDHGNLVHFGAVDATGGSPHRHSPEPGLTR